MAVLKCESCGAPLEFSEGMSVVKCEWCGYSQTIPSDVQGLSTDEMIEWAKKYESNFSTPRDMQKALLWYEKAANAGDFAAERKCGLIYGEGLHGIAQDVKKAEEYYTRSADHGDIESAQLLGICYIEGRNGFPVDSEKGFHWIKKSADSGFSPAFCTVGWCYYEGKGVTKDYETALKWFEKAAKNGNSAAMGNIAELYLTANGQYGIKTDYFEAVEWAEKAIEASKNDNSSVCNAYYVLGYCTLFGKGTAKDVDEGYKLLEKADSKGEVKAAYLLGCINENPSRYGLDWQEPSYPEDAYKYYMKAARLDDANAQEAVSRCFRKGIGIEKNAQQADKWHKKAIENGYESKTTSTVSSIKNSPNVGSAIKSFTKKDNKGNTKRFNKRKFIIIGICVLLVMYFIVK